MTSKLYPHGKAKAFTVTYDDGVLQDVRFVGLLNQYGLKGTFNLNSRLMEDEFEWTHEAGLVIKRLSREQAVPLYSGHEVASHTLTHPYMDHLGEDELMHELQADKTNLEKLFGREIRGFAVPFDYYSGLIEKCVKKCGFEYARISVESHSFVPQDDYFHWKAGIFHLNGEFTDYVRAFLSTSEELAFCQIAGHSYDLDIEDMWGTMEDVFRAVSAGNDILPMTTIELIHYLKAMGRAEITDSYIKNNSDTSLWFRINDSIHELKACEELYF